MFTIKNNWDTVLLLAKFKYDNSKYCRTKYSLFYITYSFNTILRQFVLVKDIQDPPLQLYTYYLE